MWCRSRMLDPRPREERLQGGILKLLTRMLDFEKPWILLKSPRTESWLGCHQQSDGLRRSAWAGQHAMVLVSRRDKHCLSASGAEVAEPAQRATELARRRGLQGHRGRPWGHQPWPGGGWRRPRPACGRRASVLNIHVPYTHTTSHLCQP